MKMKTLPIRNKDNRIGVRRGWFLPLAVLLLVWWGWTGTARAQTGTRETVFVLLARSDPALLAQVVQTVQERGGEVAHLFPHRGLVVRLPDGVRLDDLPGVALTSAGPVDLPLADLYGPEARRLAVAWNSLVAPAPAEPLETLSAEGGAPYNDALVPPDLPPDGGLAASGSGITPGYYQTSEFMAGSVAVGIILVESDGSIDPSTEDWTEDEKQQVFSEIVSALEWWASREPRANLSFVYDNHAFNPLPTGVEPITRPYYDQQYWIADAMQGLGYSSASYFTAVRDYNNALRNTYQTDWAFTIFVVDSSNDADNYFSNGYFAYAYLGGPFLVMTYGNNGYGPSNMDAVAAHEVGHIFYALDQYYSAARPCDQRSGYLYVENQNSQYGNCALNTASIMRGQITPYTLGAVDPYAAGQIGWRDSDGDNILDPLDVGLPVTIGQVSTDGSRAEVTGTASITPYPSAFPYHPSVTINRLTGVQYRLDGGSWQNAAAADGQFDGVEEAFQILLDPLAPGAYMLDVAAVDSAGNVSDTYAQTVVMQMDAADPELNTVLYLPAGESGLSAQAAAVEGVSYSPSRTIAAVRYRVDGGPWQLAQPKDGAFDSGYEPFTISLAGVPAGQHTLEAMAVDTTGYSELQPASEGVQAGGGSSYQVFLPLVVGGT
ncbi:MAG: hypothetical protein D6784_08200 [Chloroflexi bacterium]|nr:MAG: hypothetical protein D6784_08200 [Chloroflexota bacterium]